MGFVAAFSNLKATAASVDTVSMTADWIMVEDGNGEMRRVAMTTSVVIDKTVAGPAVNGCDQAGAFPKDSWVHFYAIYNPFTGNVAGLFSASATAPTLPSGYTFKAYLGAARNNSSGTSGEFDSFTQSDRHVSATFQQVSSTIGTTRGIVDMSNNIPPTAKRLDLYVGLSAGSTVLATAVNFTADAAGSLGRRDFQCDFTSSAETCLPISLQTPQSIWGIRGAGTFTVSVYTSNWSY